MGLWAGVVLLGVAVAGARSRRKEAVAEDVWISGDKLEQGVQCQHNAVHVLGNGGYLTIEGRCTAVYVDGNRNWIEVQDADVIVTRGDMNSVMYLNPGTRVVDPGRANSVAPRWPQ